MLQSRLAINAATTRKQWSLLEAIDGYSRLGVAAIAPWRDQLQETGVKVAARALRDAGLPVSGLCRGGMFTAATAEGRMAAVADNRRAIEEAAKIGAPVLVLVCGGLPQGSRDIVGARAMVQDGIAAILPEAQSAGIKLAVEPLHPMYAADRSCINTLDQALDICDALDPMHELALGVIFDVYHLWWDPQIMPAIKRSGRRLHGFHISDWVAPLADMLNDRGMMGDGAIDIAGLARGVMEAGYTGLAEVEIFSDRWWQEEPEAVIQTCLKRWHNVHNMI